MAKYSSGKYQTSSLKTAIKAAIFIFAALLLVIIGAGGRLIAENLLMPLFKDVQSSVTPMPEGYKNGVIVLPRLNLYTVELNSFDQASEASQAAADLRRKGGAGYVFEQDGLYRLLASGYVTAEDARSVAEKQAEEKYSPAVYLISSGSVSFNVTCAKESFESINKACTYYPELISALVQETVELEKQELTQAVVKVRYASVASELERIVKELENVPSSADDTLINELLTLYNNTILQIKKIFLENFQYDIDFFAEIRYNYIQMAVYYCETVQNLS